MPLRIKSFERINHILSNQLEETVWYEYTEDPREPYKYGPGGYHPVMIGDVLHKRYHVHHKLGRGGVSTIWLAKDMILSKYVAVKVGIAESDNKEVEILSKLTKPTGGSASRGEDMIIPVLDYFSLDGPNGTHPCSVTVPARLSLANLTEYWCSCDLPLPVVRSLAAQMVITVAYIHGQGFVHGDLHLGNVLLQLPERLDTMSQDELYEEYGPPDPEPMIRRDGKPLAPGVPSHIFEPIWFGINNETITLPESRILIADFGTAFCPAEEDRFQSYTPLTYRPPEPYFEPKTPLSYPSDIWSLGCAIWEMSGGGGFLTAWLWDEVDAINEQVDRLGPLSPEWSDKWKRPPNKFGVDGVPLPTAPDQTWEGRFEETIQEYRRRKNVGAFDEDEIQAFQEMLKGMIVYRPGERLTAEQVLNTRWMREYALPEWEKIGK
ncbi:kinase-like domain-containing protein [Fusarium flagelliforme]|uniref:kinase-like domain-containing protein n=1 Tax=Fusarium flagelliforme TaxID=2675880 RepID=UPI001E8D3BB5|nr:kinase-like domain-containing protein [Fusarium flagelliforme]KAH7174668.1 kinase-like domain-containing protein [Fusarium flagelliforme]